MFALTTLQNTQIGLVEKKNCKILKVKASYTDIHNVITLR